MTVPSTHHCFGSPPIQIDTDTQGPPCVAYWSGDNGGATSRGVTRSTIRIMVPEAASGKAFPARMVADLEEFFNRNFELYGRQLEITSDGGSPSTCAEVAAEADGAAAAGAFAVGDPEGAADSCFFAAAARDHLVSAMYLNGFGLSSAVLQGLAPYVYTYDMAYDRQFSEDGAFICSQLAHRTASYAPDPSLALSQRKFGLILIHDDSPWTVDTSPLYRALARCGVSIAPGDREEGSFTQGASNADAQIAQFAATAVTHLHEDGVTTVLCADLCSGLFIGQDVCGAASAQGYHPEWIFMDSNLASNTVVKAEWPCADEETADLNVLYQPPQVPYPAEPLNRALNEVDPSYQFNGPALDLEEAVGGYEQLLLIASGIQMAGPDLTPTTFERGLQLARFPNPFSFNMEGAVGFGGGSFSMTTDAAVAWFNPSAPSVYPDEGAGSWCYAEGGRRFTAAEWATTADILPASLATAPCANSPPGS